METVSWIAIAVIAATLMILFLRKYSPTMVLMASNAVIFSICIFGNYDTLLFELSFKSEFSMFASEPWTIVTSMFMHADIMHLAFNMIFLFAIGMPLEQRIGKTRFIAIYLVGGMIGSLIFMIMELDPYIIVMLVGASGAISALMGAMLMLYPRDRITFFLGPVITNQFTVRTMILVWFALQLFLLAFDSSSAVAYTAHLGGFAAGAGIAWMIRPQSGPDRPMKAQDISALKKLCTTPSLREMYNYAGSARDIETRNIWTERLLAEVRCPVCGSPIKKKRNGFECTEGHEI